MDLRTVAIQFALGAGKVLAGLSKYWQRSAKKSRAPAVPAAAPVCGRGGPENQQSSNGSVRRYFAA